MGSKVYAENFLIRGVLTFVYPQLLVHRLKSGY